MERTSVSRLEADSASYISSFVPYSQFSSRDSHNTVSRVDLVGGDGCEAGECRFSGLDGKFVVKQ